jgi:hypothetical protein
MTWLFEPHNTIFTIAFVVMLCFAVLEILSLLLGLGISEWLHDLLPHGGDSSAEVGVHADAHAEVAGTVDSHMDSGLSQDGHIGMMHSLLNWLEIGKLPLLVTMNIFFAAFSITGFLLQGVTMLITQGHALPPWLAGIIAFAVALPALKLGNKLFSKIWPQDETSAVKQEEFIGCHGVVATGLATCERAAEVKFIGPRGDIHYFMAFAIREDLPQGTPIVLVAKHPEKLSHFIAMRNPDPQAPGSKSI